MKKSDDIEELLENSDRSSSPDPSVPKKLATSEERIKKRPNHLFKPNQLNPFKGKKYHRGVPEYVKRMEAQLDQKKRAPASNFPGAADPKKLPGPGLVISGNPNAQGPHA